MCSFLVQIVYGVVCLAATAMTVVAIFTPGWTTYSFNDYEPISQGILPFTCASPAYKNNQSPVFNWSDCTTWFNNLPWTEKVIVACMCIGLAFQYILHPLSVFTLLAVIFLAIAVIMYAIFDNQYIEFVDPSKPIDFTMEIGFSFWLACGALALNVINMIVSSAALCCAKGCC